MHLADLAAVLAVPALVWTISYVLLAREFGRWNLLKVKIHESGHYTLAETLFYYSHFLRELPIDTLLACAVLWTYSVAGPRVLGMVGAAPALPLILGSFLLIVFGGSLSEDTGPKSSFMFSGMIAVS